MGDDSKRPLRSKEILGPDDGRVMTRLLVNGAEFSRIIGKGGVMVASIRSQAEIHIKGVDIDEDRRLVLLSGNFDNVVKGFDLICDLLRPHDTTDVYSAGIFALHVMLEHGKAGKVVGTKGVMMQVIKEKSTLRSVKIDKDPIHYSGVQLRDFTMEGTILALKRAHVLLLDLFFGSFTAGGARDISSPLPAAQQSTPQQQERGTRDSKSATTPIMLTPTQLYSKAVGSSSLIPLSQLVEVGVQPETVRQLIEMKAYLKRHFQINLCCSRGDDEVNSSASGGTTDHTADLTPAKALTTHEVEAESPRPSTTIAALAIRRELSAQKVSNAAAKGDASQELCFAVPQTCVGIIIGKAAQGIKDLQADFTGVKVYIESECVEERRIVVLSHKQSAGKLQEGVEFVPAAEVTTLLENCQAKIIKLVEKEYADQMAAAAVKAGVPAVASVAPPAAAAEETTGSS